MKTSTPQFQALKVFKLVALMFFLVTFSFQVNAQTISGPASVCLGAGATATYTCTGAGSGTYTWTYTMISGTCTPTGIPVSGVQTVTTIDWGSTIAIVRLSVATPSGTVSMTVQVGGSLPQISGATNVCSAFQNQYSVVVDNNPWETYSWSVDGGSPQSGTSIYATWPSPGTYTITLQGTITGANSVTCNSDIVTKTVIVTDPPLPGEIGGSPKICNGTPATFTAPAGTYYNYNWSVTGTSGSVASISTNGLSSITVTAGTVSGTITMTVSYSNVSSGGCTVTTDIFTVTVDKPAPSISGTTVICHQDGAPYTTTASASSTYQWTITPTAWATGTANSSTGTLVTITWSNTTITAQVCTITLSETNTSTCIGSTHTVVTINPRPTVNPISSPTYCVGSSVPATPVYSPTGTGTYFIWDNSSIPNIGIGTGGSTYEYIPADGSSFTALNATAHPVVNTIAVTPYYVNGGITCSGSTRSFTITVNPNVSTPTAITCSPGSEPACQLTNSITTTSYTSTVDIGAISFSVMPSGAGTIGAASGLMTWTNGFSGTATITATATGCGPPQAAEKSVVINPRPTVTTSNTDLICSGQNLNIGLISTIPSSTFTWTTIYPSYISGSGTASGSGLTITGQLNNSSSTATGTVQYLVTPTSSLGCTGNVYTITVTVNPAPTLTNISNPSPICSGASTGISLTPSIASTFYWSPGSSSPVGSISGASAGSGTATINTINQPLTNTSSTTTGSIPYTVTLTSSAGCAGSTYTISVEVKPAPTITTASSKSICSGTPTGITLTSSISSNFVWSVGTITGEIITGASSSPGFGPSINQILSNPSNTSTGAVPYIVTPTSISGNCQGNAYTITVTVNPRPEIIPPTPNVKEICSATNTGINLTASASSEFSWTIGAASSNISGYAPSSGFTVVASINQTLTNTSNSSTGTVQYIVTPRLVTGGCVGNAYTITVTVKPLPVIEHIDDRTYCPGSLAAEIPLVSSIPGASIYWELRPDIVIGLNPTYGSGSPIPSFTVTNYYSATITTAVYIEPYANGCFGVGSSVFTITVLATGNLATPTLNGDFEVCPVPINYSTDAGSGESNYIWTVTPSSVGSITTANNIPVINVLWSNTGTTPVNATITVNYTNSSGCTAASPTAKSVTVYPNQIPSIYDPGATVTCSGHTRSYTLSTTDSIGNYILWSVSPGGTITSANNTRTVTVKWNDTGQQSVSVTCNSIHNCLSLSPAVLSVTVTQSPVPTIISDYAEACQDEPTVYTTQPGMINYSWTVGNGGDIITPNNAQTVTVNWTETGTRTISVNYSDGGCRAGSPSQRSITVNARPASPTISGGLPTVCSGSTYTYFTQSGMTNYQWEVSSGGTILTTPTTNTSTITVRWDVTGTQSLSVNYSSGSLCSALSPGTLTCTVADSPFPSFISGQPTVCANVPGNVYQTQTGMSNYTWTLLPPATGTITSGGSPASSSVTVTWLTAGLKTVTVSYRNSSGCLATIPAVSTTTVFDLPVPIITPPVLSPCEGSSGNVYSTTTGMNDYLWMVYGGTPAVFTGTDNISVTWGLAGTRTVSVTYTDLNGCTPASPSIKTVTVKPLPVPTIGGPGAACSNSVGYVYTASPDMTGYTWEIIPAGTYTMTGQGNKSITVNWTSPGVRTITVSGNLNGCSAAAPGVLSLTVDDAITPTIYGSGTVCSGQTYSYYTTVTGLLTYAWSVTPGLATITSGQNTNSITVIWYTAGSRTLSLLVTDQSGCASTVPSTLPVTVNTSPPTPLITGSPSGCIGSSGYTYFTDSGMSSYTWDVTGGIFTTVGAPYVINITWNSPGVQTITVNSLNSYGCNAAIAGTLTVSIGSATPPLINSSLTKVCTTVPVYYTTEQTGTLYNWTITAGAGTIFTGTGSYRIGVIWDLPGNQTVEVSYNNANNCLVQGTKSVTVGETPSITINGDATSCLNGIKTYSTKILQSDYVWFVSPGGTITSGWATSTITVQWSQTGIHTVTVSYIDPISQCGVPAPAAKTVTVYTPVATLTGPPSGCTGGQGSEFSTQAGMMDYNWTVTSGGAIVTTPTNNTNTVTVVWNTAGAQTVYVSYTDINGCSPANPAQSAITVYARPGTPTITGSNTPCNGSTYTYTTQASMTNYTWNVSAGGSILTSPTTGSNSIQVHWNSSATSSEIVEVNYSLAGCAALATGTLTCAVYPPVDVPLNGPPSTCVNTNGNVYQTQVGMSNYIWTLLPTGTGSITTGGTSSSSSVTVTWTTPGLKTVTVNYTNPSACSATSPASFTTTVNTLPVPTITGALSACASSTVVYYTEPGMTSYVWTAPGGIITDGGSSTSTSVTVTWNTVGTQTVTVNYINATGCTASIPAFRNVVVNPLPLPNISGPPVVCVNSAGHVYYTEAGMTNYIWTIIPTGVGTITSGIGSRTITVTWYTNGTQTVSVNYTNGNSCTASTPSTKSVKVQGTIIPDFTGIYSTCIGNTYVYYTDQTEMNNYLWAIPSGGGTILTGQATSSITVIWNDVGDKTLSLTFNDPIGCTIATPTVKTIVVNNSPVITITGVLSICQGSSAIYTTESGKSDYDWSVSPGNTYTSTANIATVNWLAPGIQSISVNYKNSEGCFAVNPKVETVTVGPVTAPPINSTNPLPCTGNTVYYSTVQGMTMYQWSAFPGGTIVSGDGTYSIGVVWNTPGSKTVTVSYSNTGCLTTGLKSVTVNPSPQITITGNPESCVNATETYSTQTGHISYNWTVGSGGTLISGLGTSTITVNWTQAGPRTVSVTCINTNGCPTAQPALINVTVHTAQQPTITKPLYGCTGTGAVFSTESGMTAYDWSVTGGGTISPSPTTSASTITVVWNASGLQTVYVNYTDNHGCRAASYTSTGVTINASPSNPTISGTTTVCAGSTYTYTTQAAQQNYTWNVSAGGTILTSPTTNTNIILVRWNSAPEEQVVQVNYSNGSCIALSPGTLSCTINIPTPPTLSGVQTACVNTAGNTYTTESAKSNYSWTISPGGTITAGGSTASNTITVTWISSGLKTVTVNYANSSGCMALTPASFTTTVNPVPNVNTVTSQTVCNGFGTVGITFTGSVPETIYDWVNSNTDIGLEGSGTGTITSFTAQNTGTTPLTATITVTPSYTNGITCSGNQTSFTITVNPTPTVILSGGSQIVSNGALTTPVDFIETAPGTVFEWINNMPSIGLPANGTGDIGTFTATNTSANPVTATITVTPKFTNGGVTCSGTPAVFTITVYSQFVPGVATASQEICSNSIPAALNATDPTGGNTPYSFLWQSSPDNGVYSDIAGSTAMTYQPGALTTTTWFRQAQTASSSGGTVYTNPVKITVNPLPVPTITGSPSACAGSTANNYTTQSGMTNYIWNILPGVGTITSGTGTNSIGVNWSSGTRTMTVNYKDLNGCTAQIPGTFTVTVYPILQAGTVSENQSICYAATPNVLTATVPVGGDDPYTYVWQISSDNSNYSNITGATVLTYQPGPLTTDTWYRQAQTSAGVCGTVYTNAVKITVNPLPVPTIGGPTTACVNSTGNVYFTETGMSNYAWTVSGGTITAGGTPTSSNVTVTWNTAGTNTVSVNYTNPNPPYCTAAQPTSLPVVVNAIPTITGTTPNSRCDAGTVVLGATSSAGTINWYAAQTSVVSLGTGTSFTTPVISATTTYWVDATIGICTSTRTAVTATINVTPSITGVAPAARCGPGVLILGASASTGTINWYAAPNGGTSLETGNSFTTPVISSTTTYYVDVTSGSCTSLRTAVVATINPIPAITGTTPASRCDAGSVTLQATASAGTINWYAAPTGGTSLGSGNSFITPSLSATTTYYVDATMNTCTTAARTAIIATINVTPSIISTIPATRCGPGTVTLVASASSGTINWYAAPTGGTSLGTGNSFTTPVISATTTYYVDATSGICTSSPRTAVLATVNPLPVPTITGPGSACLSSTGNAYYTEAGMNGYTWSVDGGTITAGSGTNSISVTWTSAGIRTIGVNYAIPGTGCTAGSPTIKMVAVNTLPQPTITGPTPVCVNSSVNIYTTEAGMTGYTWNVTGGTIVGASNTRTISVTWTNAGINLVTVNYFNPNGCTALIPASLTITVQSAIIPQITGPDPSCLGGTVTYTTDNGMSNYNWTISSGGTILSGQTSVTVAVNWTSTGSQWLSVNYTDPLGCATASSTIKTVQVNNVPTPTIVGSATICQGTAGVVYFTEPGMTNYAWTVTGGSITSGIGTNVIQITWITAGTQSITVNYTNTGGCSALVATTKTVTVIPIPLPVIAGPTTICTGNTAYYSTEPGMTNYVWNLASGGTIVSGLGTNVIGINWTAMGTQTITVSYINQFGCPATVPGSWVVTVNLSPSPTITGVSEVCVNGTSTYSTEPAMALYTWTVGSGGIITSGMGTSTITVMWTQSGARTVTVTYTNPDGGCSASVLKHITILAAPIPVIAGPAFACTGGTGSQFTTDEGMTGYVWSVSSGGVITSPNGTQTVTVNWNTAGLQSVYVSYTDANGCSSLTPSQYNLSVNLRPDNPIITGSSVACAGTAIATYTTQSGMNSYAWSILPGVGTITGGQGTNTVSIVWLLPGTQTVSVNYANGSGCPTLSPGTFTCVVDNQPTPTFLSGQTAACVNSTGNNYTTQNGQTNYTWTISAGGIITAGGTSASSSITVTWTTPGLKTVTVNYINSSGCSATAPAAFTTTVNPLPVPTLTGNIAACVNSTGNFYYTETGMTGYTWLVDGGTIDGGSGTNTISVTWLSAGTRTVSVNYTVAETGCTAGVATMKNVIVNPLPIPVITGPTAACIGSTGNLYTTDAGMTGYSWNVSGGTIVGATNTKTISITWNNAGVNHVSVNYFNSSGCAAATASSFTVTVQSTIIPQITGPNPSCVGGTVTYTTDPGMSDYSWTISPGGMIVSGQASSTVIVTWTSPGTQSVGVTYSDPLGCTTTTPSVMTVVVYSSPTPTITGSGSLCQGSSGVVYFTESGKSGYVWTISSGGIITNGQGTSVITVSWITSGMQTVTVNYANSSGCYAGSATVKTVNVFASASPTITGQVVICNGNTYTYTTEPEMLNYDWQLSSGGTIISGSNSNVITVLWTTVGTHTITVSYLNTATNCPTTVPTSLSILVNPSPEPTISGADTVCLNGTVVFTTEPGNALYNWTIGSGGLITSGVGTNSIAVKWTLPGIRTVTVNYTNTSNCSAAQPATLTIVVYAPPVPVISGLNNACSGGSEYIYSTTAGLTNYAWNVSSGGTITTGAGTNSITVAWTANGLQTVTLSYTDIHGCSTITPSQFAVTVNPRPLPTITGTASACVGSTNNIYSTQTGMTGYSWNVSAGGTILTSPTTNASTITVVWNTSGIKTVSVNYTNTKNCDAIIPATFTCTVYDLPVPTVNGPVSVCVNSTSNVYRTESGKSNYTWTISPGGIITAGGTAISDSIQISWVTTGTKTVSVNYANAFQCMAAVPGALSVTVNSLPVPTIIGSGTGCPGVTTNIYATEPLMTNYSWTVSSGGIITSGQGTQTITVTWTLAGTETITVNYRNAAGCEAETPTVHSVIINPLPVPVISGFPDGCLSYNSIFNTEAGMTNYTWTVSPGGTLISGTNSPTVTINWISAGLQTVTVSYTNQNGCTAIPIAKSVTVHDYVIPVISGPVQGCTGIPVVYSTQAGMSGYAWTLSTSGVIIDGTGTETITVIWYSPGVQTVMVNYVNSFGCTAVNPGLQTTTVTTSPVPWINGTNLVCQGTTGVVYSTNDGMQNYQWNVSQGGIITSGTGTATITVTWSLPGIQTVTVNYTDISGCSAATAFAKTVTVSPTPVPLITGPAAVCAGSSVVYFTEPGMSGYQWNISPGGVITSSATGNAITVDWISAGAQSVTVVYTSGDGCAAVVPTLKTVTVNPLPVPTIGHDSVACIFGTTTFFTEPGMGSYQWTVSSGGVIVAGSGTNSIVVSWSTAGTKTITISYVNANGCYPAQLTSKSFEVSALPVPTITGPGSACIGASGNIYFTEPGMSNYTWIVSSGGVITGGAGTNSVTVTWTSLTPQVISVNYISPAGCSAASPAQFGVGINPLPVVSITGTSVTCAGSTNSVYTTEPGMTNYQWNVSAGGTIITTPTTNASTIMVAWIVPGIQSVMVNYTNANGCLAANPSTKTVLVQISPLPVITGVSSICQGTTGVVYATDPGNFGYVWTVTPGGAITAGNGTNQVTVSWLVSGTQTLTVNYSNSLGCSAGVPTAKSITVNALPMPGITGNSYSCINGTASYTTETSMTGYVWTVSAGGTILSGSGSSQIQVQWTTPGIKTVSVNYINANGCTAAMPSTTSVMVYSLPVPIITGPGAVCTGTTGVTYSTEGGMTNYLWTISPGGTITAGAGTSIITVTWNTPGIQSVSVSYTNAYGCSPVNPTNLPVTVNAPPVPTITGNNQLCVNSGNYTYSTEPGMLNYLWTVASGGIIVSGQGTSSIQINWSVAGIHPISVGYTSAGGCIAVPTIMNVTVKSLPDAHGPIAGDTLICKPLNGVVYSIAPIANATGYVWNVPVFANIISGSNTNIITVDYGDATQSGNVSVFGTNSCGNGPFAPLLPVGVYPYPETPHVTVIEPDTLVSSAPSGNQWYREFVPIPGATGQTYIATNIGRYFVIANPNGCISDTSNIIYMFPVGMDEEKAMIVNVYPNPADDFVTLKINTAGREEILSVRLINSIGQGTLLLSDFKLNGEVTRNLDLGNPPNGIYHLVMQFGKNNVIRKLIIINE